jgi:hypothetical protein
MTPDQRYCTACAVAALLGFLAFALYINPTGLSRLNPFSTQECEPNKYAERFDAQNATHEPLSIGKGREGGTPSKSTQSRPASPQQETNQNTDIYACRLAIYTHQLAVFTALLAFATIILIAIGVGQAHALIRTARAAEQALTEVERPWLFLQEIKIIWRGQHPPPTGLYNEWIATLVFRNIGRMPAVVEDLVFKIEPKTRLPPKPNYNGANHLSIRRAIPTDVEAEAQGVGPAPGPDPTPLVFYGVLTYRELGGKVHHTGFAREMSWYMAGEIPYANAAYDYYD